MNETLANEEGESKMKVMRGKFKLQNVEVVILTPENLEEVESWCGGSIKGTALERKDRIIHIWDKDSDSELTLHVGEYLVKSGLSSNPRFLPCTKEVFEKTFTISSFNSTTGLTEFVVVQNKRNGEHVIKRVWATDNTTAYEQFKNWVSWTLYDDLVGDPQVYSLNEILSISDEN